MAGAAGRPARRAARAALAGAVLALALAPGCAADRRRDREAVCRALAEKAADQDDMTLALLCRSRVPTDICREVQTSLGERPWTRERIDATCHTWTASPRLRLLQVSPPDPGPGAGSTTDETLSPKAAKNRENILDAEGKSEEVDAAIKLKKEKAIDNVTAVDKAVCEKAGLAWEEGTTSSGSSGGSAGSDDPEVEGQCVRPTRPPTWAPTPAPPPTPSPTPPPPTPSPPASTLPVSTTPVSTTLTSSVAAGATELPVESTVGFDVGATILIEGGGNEETGVIASVGSIVLTTGLAKSYPADSTVSLYVTAGTTGSNATGSGSGSNATGSTPSDDDIGFAEMLKNTSDAHANVSVVADDVTPGALAQNATTNGTADAGPTAGNASVNGTFGAKFTTNLSSVNASANVSAAAANVTPETPAGNASADGTFGAKFTTNLSSLNASANVSAAAANVTPETLAGNASADGTFGAKFTTNLSSLNASANVSAAAANVTPETPAGNASVNGTFGAKFTTNLSSLNASANVSAAAANVTPETPAGNASADGTFGASPNGSVSGDTRLFDLRYGILPAANAGGMALTAAAGVVLLVASVSAARWGAARGRAHDSRLIYIPLSQESDEEEDGGASGRRTLPPDLESRAGDAGHDSREWLALE